MKIKKILLTPLFILILNSCLGINTDIQMRRDGSGRITMEYKLSRMAETIGRLDGNEQWPVIPVGRADWERTAARIDGIRLVSFSGREDNKDFINRATLEFADTDALLKLLDSAGKRASINRENNSNKLNIILNEKVSPDINPDLLELMKQVSAGYMFRITFSAQGNSSITFTDGAGKAITQPAGVNTSTSGRTLSFTIDTAELLNKKEGLGVSFTW
ncbi:MAG: hypothetical protein FWC03_04630 [Treponema sp.]|nr:hypothetical protein [Treponema sp.]